MILSGTNVLSAPDVSCIKQLLCLTPAVEVIN